MYIHIYIYIHICILIYMHISRASLHWKKPGNQPGIQDMLFLKLHGLRAGRPTGKTSKHSLKLFSKWKPLKIGPNCHKSIHLSAPSMDFDGRTLSFREGMDVHIQCFFWESTLEGKVSHHLKRGTMFEMLARKYPEILHTMMWRPMVCRSLKFFPIWIRSIQIADMTCNLRQKTTFFLQKTISLSPVSHNYLILIPFVAFTNSDEIPFFSTPQLATHNDWKASKHWNAFSSCATWGTWIMQPFTLRKFNIAPEKLPSQ